MNLVKHDITPPLSYNIRQKIHNTIKQLIPRKELCIIVRDIYTPIRHDVEFKHGDPTKHEIKKIYEKNTI
jgi:hypothetical protein